MEKKNNFIVDYYFTKKSTIPGDYDTYRIVDKIKMKASSSDGGKLGDNIDVFLNKKDFPDGITPNSHDMVFFYNEKRFYNAIEWEEAGDCYVINLNIYKQKEK